jgi:hypothetical protein
VALERFAHVGSTTVSSGGTDAPAAGTEQTWTVSSSGAFPATLNQSRYFKVVDPAANGEVILVKSVSGTTWTVVRGADSTTPVIHQASFTVTNVVSRATMDSVVADSAGIYNVLDYGALGDDSNADHVGIQAALSAAWADGGGTVVIPKGKYRIMQAPLRIRENIRVTASQGAVIKRYNDFSSLVWNGDGSQDRAGYTGHGSIIIEGGVWDMRCTTATVALGSDDFTRSNTTAPHGLGTSTGGQEWTTEQGTLGITSNTAYAPTAQGNISSIYGFSDGTVSVVMPTVGNAGLVFRMSDSQNYWYYRRHTDGNARMGKVVNGTETVMTADATQAVSAGNTLKVVMQGSTIKAFVGTTLTHTDVDSSHRDERKVGIQILDTTARLDTFSNSSSMWADDFNRTNSSSSLGTSSSGQTWTTQSGTMGITSNTAYAPSGGSSWATLDATSETNVVVTMPTVGNAGIIFRYKDNNNYWYYRRHTDGNARLGKVVAGVDTAMTADTPTAVAAGNTLKVQVLGWQIRAFVGTTKTHDDTDSDHYQETKVGIQILDTAARLDTFDAYAASGTDMSGACFNFGHGENITFRDLTIRDNSMQSHGVEICGCRNVLFDNCAFLGAAFVTGRDDSEAIQLDMTKGAAYFAAFGPHDHTTCKDVTIRNCTVGPSGSIGTQKWGRGTGSHSGTIGRWHDNIRVQGNFFEVGYRAVRGYNWNNAVVSGNNIASGNGIEIRPIWTGNTEDTKDVNGTQTSASQNIVNVVVADNTITHDSSGSDLTNDFAIRVFGEDTGRVIGATISGNVVASSLSGGIRAQYCDKAILANNSVATSGRYGMQIYECADTIAIGNIIQLSDLHGLYVVGGDRIRIMSNYIKGASRASAGASSCIKLDTSPDEVTISDNVCRLWGSGNEPAHGLHQSTGTNTTLLDNDFVGSGTTADVNMLASAEIGKSIYREATATTTIGTSNTAVAGLTMTLPVGRWRFEAWIPCLGTNTNVTAIVSPTGPPTTSSLAYSVEIIGAAADTDTYSTVLSSFTQTTNSGIANVRIVRVQGSCVVTTAGTLSVSLLRAGTDCTTQIGAYLQADRK